MTSVVAHDQRARVAARAKRAAVDHDLVGKGEDRPAVLAALLYITTSELLLS
jgi:hypothetical protein